MRHELKIDSKNFNAILFGNKTYEIRLADRDYMVMDKLLLRETRFTGKEMKQGKPLAYTGKRIYARVTHVLQGPIYGLKEEWVILSLSVYDMITGIKIKTI